jgi:hypothetical protein
MPNNSLVAETLSDRRFSRLRMMDSVFTRLQESYQPPRIIWATDKDGNEMNPAYLWDRYYLHDVEVVRKEFMVNMDNFLDRHKIIALTQRIVMDL